MSSAVTKRRKVSTVVGMVATVALLTTSAIFLFSGVTTSVGASTLRASCTNSVSISVGPPVFAATKVHVFTLKITNSSAKSCVVEGYPTVRFTNAKHQVLPFTYTHRATGGYLMTEAPPKLIVLKPNRSAYVLIAKSSCVGLDRKRATSVSVYVPGPASGTVTPSSNYQSASFKYPKIFTCSGADAALDNTVAVSPIEPSAAATT